MRGAWRVWQRNFESWKRFYRASLVGNVLDPILYFVALGFGLGAFVRPIQGEPYLAFIAPGLLAGVAMNTAAFENTIGSFVRMEEQKTFKSILMTPVSVAELAAGEILWGASKSLLSGAIFLVLIRVTGVWGSSLEVLNLGVAFLVGLLFGGMALCWTALSPSYDFFNYFFTLVVSVMFLFSGIFFPVDALPDWAGLAAELLPLTHAVDLARALHRGQWGPELLGDLLWLATAAALFLWLAVRLLERRIIR
ncbi:MAG: ABC transporter permease [Gemmatimonadota bacterium]